MSETAPVAPADLVLAPMEKPPVKKRGRKPVGLTGASRKTTNPSVSKLIIEALSMSQERAGMSLAALKKALAAAGYDVERNNSRIKLGLKSLVTKGILVQTRGTGASGSFKLSRKSAPEPTKVRKPASTKAKKLVSSRDVKSPKSAKSNKTVKKPRATTARSGRKAKGAKAKQQRKSPAKARAGNLNKTGNPKLTQQKTSSRRATKK
ncbi:histone H1t [Vicugna pacos]|uniref:Histone H1t n=1 Tax=Vicugna pacos TaxID=30538 RepID=A0A6I9IR67_VICPA